MQYRQLVLQELKDVEGGSGEQVVFIGPASWAALVLVNVSRGHCEDFDSDSEENCDAKLDISQKIIEVGSKYFVSLAK